MNNTVPLLFGFAFIFLVVGAMIAPAFRIRLHFDRIRKFYFAPGFFIVGDADCPHRDHETGFQRDDKWRSREN